MYMRVTRFTSSTPLDEQRIAEGGNRLAEAFGQTPGYLGWSALLDPASGEAASVTYWADAESMQASEEAGAAVRARTVSEGAQLRDVQRYERLIQERVGPPRTGLFARVTSFSIAPERMNELISHMSQVSVPQAKAQPGFQSFLVSANRETGQVGVASVWESEAAREASNTALSEERRQTAERFGATLDSIQTYEIVAVDVKLPAPA
jgi:heme-degrading monooxygenase HmoA